MIPVIPLHKVWLGVSGALVAASVVLFFMWGLKPGLDFTGGSFIQVEFSRERPSKEAILEKITPLDFGTISIQPSGDLGYFFRLRYLANEEYQRFAGALKETARGENQLIEKGFDIVGPSIGKELKQKAWQAIVVVLIGIILYVAWAFRGISKPVESWKYGIIAIAALVHDIAIPTGVFVVLGHYFGVEVDTLFVTALLAILGYSVNDTIVIFDRVRENLLKSRGRDFAEVVNESVNQTFGRSINTSFTLLLVLVAIYFVGSPAIRYFILTLIIGVVAGTYSSIFIASPLLVVWQRWGQRRVTQ